METDKSPAVWTTKRETRLRFKGNHLKKHKSHNDNSVLRSTTNNQRETNRSLITDWRHFKETPVKLSVWVETWNWQEVSVKTNRGTKIQLVCLEAESKRLQSASVGRDKTRRQKRAGCFHHLTERTTLRTSQNNQSSFYRRVGPTHTDTQRHTQTHTNTHQSDFMWNWIWWQVQLLSIKSDKTLQPPGSFSHWLHSLRCASL